MRAKLFCYWSEFSHKFAPYTIRAITHYLRCIKSISRSKITLYVDIAAYADAQLMFLRDDYSSKLLPNFRMTPVSHRMTYIGGNMHFEASCSSIGYNDRLLVFAKLA